MRLSTKAIVAFRAINRPIDENWISWAISMLEQGYDTPHLCILAGESPPYEHNQFKLIELVDKTLEELRLVQSDKNHALKEYVGELLQNMINGNRDSQTTLSELKDLCVELDHVRYLNDFYLLYFAQEDLKYAEDQYYWPGANRKNMEAIIKDVARNWIEQQMHD